MIIPPYLKKGDTIGITCPAGSLTLETISPMIEQLKLWGFQVKVGATVGTSYYKFSGTDRERLLDLQSMLDDENIHAILFGRGGYGVMRIIDLIDFSSFLNKPKWVLGYSDITSLLSHLHSQFDICSIHGHMSGGYSKNEYNEISTQSIFDTLCGIPTSYQIPKHPMSRLGNTEGVLVGGNLALLSDNIGTASDLNTDNKILFIEDIGEYLYNIDRMMWQLKRSGKLNHLKALLVGGFTQSLDNEIPFGMTEYEIVWEKVQEYHYPVYFNFPVGHQAKNVALKIGCRYILQEEFLIEKKESSEMFL